MRGVAELAEAFYQWEEHVGLFRREVAGVKYWHLLRFGVFNDFIIPRFVKFGAAHPDAVSASAATKPTILRSVMSAFGQILERVRFDPMLSFHRADVLFALEPRQTQLSDGRCCSLMLDFFISRVPSAAVLQYPLAKGYVKMPLSERVFHISACDFELHRRRRRFARGHRRETEAEATFLAEELRGEFGISVDAGALSGLILTILFRRDVLLPRFRSWLRRIGTKVVVTAVHYNLSNLILAEAAHSSGIPVVELQHGTVFRSHVAYNLPSNESVYRPDVFFAWGEFWKCGMRNYPVKSVVCTGYPYFDYHLAECSRRSSEDGVVRVLFVSQGTIGEALSEVAVRMAQILPVSRFKVSYKLHPSETNTWRTIYPALSGSRVDVIDNTTRNIYACFAESDVVIGVYSTSVVESLAWGIKAVSCRWLPGADGIQVFVDAGFVRYAETEEDLLSMVQSLRREQAEPVDVSRLWVPGAAGNIVRALQQLVDERRG
jgi:hypothetical protein